MRRTLLDTRTNLGFLYFKVGNFLQRWMMSDRSAYRWNWKFQSEAGCTSNNICQHRHSNHQETLPRSSLRLLLTGCALVLLLLGVLSVVSCFGSWWWEEGKIKSGLLQWMKPSKLGVYSRTGVYDLFWNRSLEVEVDHQAGDRPMFEFDWTQPKAGDNLGKICQRTSAFEADWVADERGYVCSREEAHSTADGCCKPKTADPTSNQFQCTSTHCPGAGDTFRTQICCNTHSHCVSCCLHPDRTPALGKYLESTILQRDNFRFPSKRASAYPYNSDRLVWSQAGDRFELCTNLCQSQARMVHRRTWVDPEHTHCHPK